MSTMITQDMEGNSDRQKINKEMISIPLRTTFLNSKQKFRDEQEILTSFFLFEEVYNDHSFNPPSLRTLGSDPKTFTTISHINY